MTAFGMTRFTTRDPTVPGAGIGGGTGTNPEMIPSPQRLRLRFERSKVPRGRVSFTELKWLDGWSRPEESQWAEKRI